MRETQDVNSRCSSRPLGTPGRKAGVFTVSRAPLLWSSAASAPVRTQPQEESRRAGQGMALRSNPATPVLLGLAHAP